MSGFQFVHIESYGRIPPKTYKKQSMRGIAKEAERHPDACKHVENPQCFELVYGEMPSKVVEDLHVFAETKKDSRGRKIRNDAQLLLGGIVSYPVPISDLDKNDPNFKIFHKRSVEFLKSYFGDNLKSIGSHSDEDYFHFHFYATPDQDNFHIRSVHPGWKAHDAVTTGKKKDKNNAYKKAMREFQDEYYNYVSRYCGLTRVGPGVQRLSRKEWKYQKEQALNFSEMSEQFRRSRKLIDDMKKEAEKRNSESLKKEASSDFLLNENMRNHEDLQERISKLNKREKDLIASVNSSFISKFNKTVQLLTQKLEDAYKKISFWKSRALTSESDLETEMKKNSQYRSLNSSLEINNKTLTKERDEFSRQLELSKRAIERLNNNQKTIDNYIRLGKTNELRDMINNNYESELFPRH